MKKVLALGLVTLTVSGCWINDLLNRNIDTLLEVRIGSDLGLYYGQKQKLEKDVSRFLQESKSLAPQIDKKLQAYSKLVDGEAPGKEYIAAESAYWRQLGQELLMVVIDRHIDYLAKLTPKQQEAFFEDQDKKDRELEKKIEKGELSDFTRGYAFFLGELNKAQEKTLKANLDYLKASAQRRLERRRSFKAELKKLFKKEAPLEDFKKLSMRGIKDARSEKEAIKRAQILTELLGAMGPEEKKQLKENIQKWRGWLEVFVSANY